MTSRARIHSIHWIHRRDGETDIYFVANTKDSTLMPHVTITGTGRLPEVWDPETGNMSEAVYFRTFVFFSELTEY